MADGCRRQQHDRPRRGEHHADPHRCRRWLRQPRRARGRLDGTWVYPLPLDPSKLSLGKHTWELNITDSAGNGNKVKFTFLVTTSLADLDGMLAKWGTAGTIPAATVTDLRAKVARRQDVRRRGDNVAAINKLQAISYSAVTNADARNTLIARHQRRGRQLRGIPDAAAPADLGITQTPAAGAPRHLYVPPSAPVRNASPAFKVLVFSNRQGDGSFRHPAIEDAEVAIQELGRKYNFDVDIWDPQYPNAGPSDTPFSSAANLAQYKVIIGDSSVGNNVLNTAYRMKDGTVVNEQTAFQQFIQGGGGYVALHAANDSLHNWGWYKDFLGGLFVSHPANQNGFAPDCGSCYWVEVNNEDPSHPSMAAAGVPKSVAVADELYHFDRKPRLSNHVLQTLNEGTYAGAMGVGTRVEHRGRRSPDRPGARTTTAAASGRRCSATTASSPDPVVPREHLPGHPDRGWHEVRQLRHPHRGQVAAVEAAGLRRDHRRGRDAGHGADPAPPSTSTTRSTRGRSPRR